MWANFAARAKPRDDQPPLRPLHQGRRHGPILHSEVNYFLFERPCILYTKIRKYVDIFGKDPLIKRMKGYIFNVLRLPSTYYCPKIAIYLLCVSGIARSMLRLCSTNQLRELHKMDCTLHHVYGTPIILRYTTHVYCTLIMCTVH